MAVSLRRRSVDYPPTLQSTLHKKC